jgi:hypothetical protein
VQYFLKQRKCQRKFYRKFPETVLPSKASIYRTTVKFCAMGSAFEEKKTGKINLLDSKKA